MTEDEFANIMGILRAKYRTDLREQYLDWSPLQNYSFQAASNALLHWLSSPLYPPGPSAFCELCSVYEKELST